MKKAAETTLAGKKAAILYYSHKGKTAFYAHNIAMYLWSKGLSVSLSSVSDASPEKLADHDYLISGCWTCGWFIIGQHPHQRWQEFSQKIQKLAKADRTLLFTTYRIRTGSMYSRMKRALGISRHPVPFLKSKTGLLTEHDKQVLDHFIGISPPIY